MATLTPVSRNPLAAIAIAGALLMASSVHAAPTAEADAVMAAVVYKITKFVSWPESVLGKSSARLSICLGETDPLLPAMQTMDGRTTQGHTIEVRLLTASATSTDGCHVLFMSASEAQRMDPTLRAAAGTPVLTVGDAEGFVDRGGIIGLHVEKSRIGFIVNLAASERAGIGISAQLLQLATIVKGEG
jgi:hypothetical protein